MSAFLNAAGAALGAAARLEAMANAMARARLADGEASPREVLLERNLAIKELAALGAHLREIGLDGELAAVFARWSTVASALAYGTLGAAAALYNARALRVFGMRLSLRTVAAGAVAG